MNSGKGHIFFIMSPTFSWWDEIVSYAIQICLKLLIYFTLAGSTTSPFSSKLAKHPWKPNSDNNGLGRSLYMLLLTPPWKIIVFSNWVLRKTYREKVFHRGSDGNYRQFHCWTLCGSYPQWSSEMNFIKITFSY